MQNNILFFQSTSIGGTNNTPGLFEMLLAHLDGLELGIFEQQQVIVPGKTIASWLKDQIAIKHGICANLDCVVLPGPVLDNIYYANNPSFKAFDFNRAKYIIYDYLCNSVPPDNDLGGNKLQSREKEELNNYIYVNGSLDKFRAYQLAAQLQKIFHEYIYLRTEDMINLDGSSIKVWQEEIIRHLFDKIGTDKTFLDVYKYFMTVNLDTLKLPQNLMLFGLNSIYPSQLNILGRLSAKVTMYWYYQTSSYKYYGDLLSDRAKSNLERKLLKKPDLNLEDLYLQDGNPLLANLAQQSREFTELLIANDIDVYSFGTPSTEKTDTILEQIQEDIRNITYRIEPDLRFGTNQEIYATPITLSNNIDNLKYSKYLDLPDGQTSIKINSCHNRMREVQVMFNELVEVLDKNPEMLLSDILITAPDIDDYAPYIVAVFDNEMIDREKLLYNITGNRKYKNYKILETLKLLLNAPYVLTVNYLIEILIQSEIQDNLSINDTDVELIRKWLYDNKIHFGYDERDYTVLGYANYQIHSFKQFLNNIVLGACISENVYGGEIPGYVTSDGGQYIPYDNLDNNQVLLCNKLIMLINQLEELRDKFYIDATNYAELTLNEVRGILAGLNESCLSDRDSINNFQRFLGGLITIPEDLIITLPILNLMLDEYIEDFKSNFMLNGNITCASMRYMRNIPFKCTYILGLNFGEYPGNYMPNQLSLLAHDWYLADRNYNIEDKQTFLDILLACKQQLYLSYIGRRETDNSEIKPSSLLGLLINTLGQSFTNFTVRSDSSDIMDVALKKYDFKNLLVQHSLHPFHNNHQASYSELWVKLAVNRFAINTWDFTKISPLQTDLSRFYTLKIEDIVRMFLYSNTNLYKVLGISQFSHELELSDTENINLADRGLAREIEVYFKKYLVMGNATVKQLYSDKLESQGNDERGRLLVVGKERNHATQVSNRLSIEEYLINCGVLSYEHIGHLQFDYYFELYNKYIAARGNTKAHITFNHTINENITLTLDDEVYLEGQTVVVMDSFANIYSSDLAAKLEDLPYSLKIRGLITYLLCFGAGHCEQGVAALDCHCEPGVAWRGNPEKVIIRQITTTGETQDFTLRITDAPILLNKVLRYYVRSLSNPVLIHKGAIQGYAKLSGMNKPQSACIEGSRSKYMADFENHDLDKIKEDIIFSSIANNYFEFMQSINGVNDIVKIGEILSCLRG
jgi:exonuclease V gamma subunit